MVPPDAELTARRGDPGLGRHPGRPQAVLARQMEVYAGFLEHTDHHVGRLVDALDDLGILEDTLVYYIIGDNGASAEGTLNGSFNELINLNGAARLETTEFMASSIDEFGTPDAYNHYAVGWAHAMDTPYQWTKQVASHWGGTRNGTIVHWPKGIEAKGEVRNQFHHVIDVAPTVLEAAGLPEPKVGPRRRAEADRGREHALRVRRRAAAERRTTQYFEMFCNRGIYHEGWTAGHPPLDAVGSRRAAAVRRRHLGAVRHEHGLEPGARPRGGDAREARRAEGALHGGGAEVQRAPARRPPRRALQLRPRRPPDADQGQLPAPLRRHGPPDENVVINVKNKSHSVTAEIEVPDGGAEGVIVAQGGAFAGWSLYVKDGKPKYCLQPVRPPALPRRGDTAIPAAPTRCAWSSTTTAAGSARAGRHALRRRRRRSARGASRAPSR